MAPDSSYFDPLLECFHAHQEWVSERKERSNGKFFLNDHVFHGKLQGFCFELVTTFVFIVYSHKMLPAYTKKNVSEIIDTSFKFCCVLKKLVRINCLGISFP